MSRLYFSTVVSDAYLTKALALHSSLMRCSTDFRLFILCVEACSLGILRELNLPNVTLIELREVEDEGLLAAKATRSYHEYYWTLKPSALFHIMNAYPDADYYAHVDSDLYFFSDPSKIFEENPKASLFLTDHHNSKRFLHTYRLYGKYNTGFVGCGNDDNARSAVAWWRWKCIEHCSVYPDVMKKTFGDQRYVEQWPELFRRVHIVKSAGANVAIWNIEKLSLQDRNDVLYADRDRLIFYHFSGLSMYSTNEFNLTWFFPIKKHVINLIYLPYTIQLSQFSAQLQGIHPELDQGFKVRGTIPDKHYYKI